jgi:predicted amidohydrolase YtcJ
MHGLLLTNARVLTVDPTRPTAAAVAVHGTRITAAGTDLEARAAAPPGAVVIDCRGGVVVPGFVDPHVHLAAYASSLQAVDCSPARVRSIEEILLAVKRRAEETPPGGWVRAVGYDEHALAEARHPNRWDLDRAAPNHPVRLLHRSGHAAVLNSLALHLAGITIATEEPPGAMIDRRLADGEPSGLLLEMNDHIAHAVLPLARAELIAGMREASERLLAAGVTAIQDMSHTNTAASHDFLTELAAESGFLPALLASAEGWHESVTGADPARPIKIMLRETGTRPLPDYEELADIIRHCAGLGRAVAVHAVERRTVSAVIRAFEQAGVDGPAHRIEHAGICPPELAVRISGLGLTVVSNPSFLFHSGARYRQQVEGEDLPHLYAVGALHRAGVRLAAAPDAPVTPPEPLIGIRTAVTRRDASGHVLPGETLAADAALALHTKRAAEASAALDDHGQIQAGMRADLVVLSGNPADPGTRVEMTVIGGRVAWQRG